MKKKTSNVVRIMKEEYDRHLKGILNELKPYTSTGIVVIGPDLKVVEKRSGLEYTVVKVDGQPGDMKITLRVPEEPRAAVSDPAILHQDFANDKPQMNSTFVGTEVTLETEDEVEEDNIDYGVEAYPNDVEYDSEDPHSLETGGETTFVVDEKTFAKYYEEA